VNVERASSGIIVEIIKVALKLYTSEIFLINTHEHGIKKIPHN
jgi:hypothetical protein